jgi:hypothetical protein
VITDCRDLRARRAEGLLDLAQLTLGSSPGSIHLLREKRITKSMDPRLKFAGDCRVWTEYPDRVELGLDYESRSASSDVTYSIQALWWAKPARCA